MKHLSILMVMAGPNGSGKSTITEQYKPIGYYVNADEIQRHLQCSPEEAANIAKLTRERLLAAGEDFTIETVLSTEMNYDLMRRAKALGYMVVCVYVLTCDPEINEARVKARVERGGNFVLPEKIKPRYIRSLKLFPELIQLCDELYVYDNSADRTVGEPKLILQAKHGNVKAVPTSIWTEDMLADLITGRYPDRFDG